MNALEQRMVEVLNEARKRYGVFKMKASFEDEGIYPRQLSRFKDIISSARLPLVVKIGGPEAITDVYLSLDVGAEGLVAPMVETPYALTKYLELIKNKIAYDNRPDIEFAFNLETITGFKNLDAMLELPDLNLLTGVTLGRVDLIGSMGLGRDAINTSEEVFNICEEAMAKAKKAGLKTGLGGGIDVEALPFIQKLAESGLLDMFETRNVCFKADAWRFGEPALEIAGIFELLHLYSLERYGSRIQAENTGRIEMLKKRWGRKGEETAAFAEKIISQVTR
ncbi:MAG: aldolase/citrate lyase family protein [Pseudomonadota bacterium]